MNAVRNGLERYRRGKAVFAAVLLAACLAPAMSFASSQGASPLPIKAVVVTMFENGDARGDEPGELQFWVERGDIAQEYPFPLGEFPLYLTADGVLIICVGGGIPNATASIMALGLDSRFDLSRAYWLVAGISGGDPQDVSLGSAVWANHVVDGDLVYEIDGREIPDQWPYGFIPLGAKEPAQGPQDVSDGWTLDTIHFPLNPQLAEWAFETTRKVVIPDMSGIRDFRKQYTGYPEAMRAPFVTRGDTLSASTYWHGGMLNTWANDWLRVYAGDDANFMTSNMEDSGTLTALHRLDRTGLVDARRVMVLRTVSNYTLPPPGRMPAWSTTAPYPDNGLPALEAAYRVGSAAIDALVDGWDEYAVSLPVFTGGDTAVGAGTDKPQQASAAPGSGDTAASRDIPVIFDTDMAIDDWAALLFLLREPSIDLRAVTVAGSGESHCEPGERNALALTDLTRPGSAIPVACGDPWPLDGYFVFPTAWQEDMDRLSGVPVPASEREPYGDHAVELIHAAIADSEQPVVLLATGPLTNIAQWLDRYPEDRNQVSRLVIMGGALDARGNIIVPGTTDNNPNTRAEWNLYVDPVAARSVLESGLPVELVGLDVTNHVQVTRAFAGNFKRRADNPAADFWSAVLDANTGFIDSGEYYFWDVLAALTIVDRERYCRGERLAVSVEYRYTDRPWLGTTDMDMPTANWRGKLRRHLEAESAGVLRLLPDGPATTLVCQQTDAGAAFEHFISTLTGPQGEGPDE
ncbi:MAG: nucleoside hydrolase [Chromatocurvus sp.]